MANLTKPRKLLNPELSNKVYRCDHSNESSRRVLSNDGVHVVAEHSSCFVCLMSTKDQLLSHVDTVNTCSSQMEAYQTGQK